MFNVSCDYSSMFKVKNQSKKKIYSSNSYYPYDTKFVGVI